MRRVLTLTMCGAALLLAACPPATPTSDSTRSVTAPGAAMTAPAATPRLDTGPETMVGSTAAAAVPASGEAGPNTLGLKLPKIDKVKNWHFGVKEPDPMPATFDPKKDYFATIKTTFGDITVKFFPDLAPRHVTSFVYLSEIGYYDGAPFHRIMPGFMMQGGDPSGQGNAGPAYHVKAEFSARKHKKGTLSMARTPDPNSAGSQFFICFADAAMLDNQYTIFGEVIEGMAVVDKFEAIGNSNRAANGVPPKSIEKIVSVRVFTKEKK